VGRSLEYVISPRLKFTDRRCCGLTCRRRGMVSAWATQPFCRCARDALSPHSPDEAAILSTVVPI